MSKYLFNLCGSFDQFSFLELNSHSNDVVNVSGPLGVTPTSVENFKNIFA